METIMQKNRKMFKWVWIVLLLIIIGGIVSNFQIITLRDRIKALEYHVDYLYQTQEELLNRSKEWKLNTGK